MRYISLNQNSKELSIANTSNHSNELLFPVIRQDHDGVSFCMPPPNRLFVPGTEEFKRAIASGYLHSSLNDSVEGNSASLEEDPTTQPLHSKHSLSTKSSDGSCSRNTLTVKTGILLENNTRMAQIQSHQRKSLKGKRIGEQEPDHGSCHSFPNNDGSDTPSYVSENLPPFGVDNDELVQSNRKRKNEQLDISASAAVPPSTEVLSSSTTAPAATQTLDGCENTRFDDIIGHKNVKLRMEEILLPLSLPVSVTNTVLVGIR